jgi:hypothetical protein
MRVEPTTLSLGSLSDSAWLGAIRRDKRNQYRWEPLGRVTPGAQLARGVLDDRDVIAGRNCRLESMAEYAAKGKSSDYEDDHLISLQLGVTPPTHEICGANLRREGLGPLAARFRDGAGLRELEGALLQGDDVGDESPGLPERPALAYRRWPLVPGSKRGALIAVELP